MEESYSQWAFSTASEVSSDDISACYNQSQTLPSFDTFSRETVDTYGQTSPTSLCDQSSDTCSSEPSFTIESIMRGDSTSGVTSRSSTPDMQKEIRKITEMNTFIQQPIQTVPEEVTHEAFPIQLQKSSVSGSNTKPYVRYSDKPPYTYAAMCITVIERSKDKALSVNSIRAELQDMFPFFRGEYKGWKSSVRHCLSSNKAFFKVETTGTSAYVWMVDHRYVSPETFKKCRSGPSAWSYRDYLHEELGSKPVCSDIGAQNLCTDGDKDIRLPEKQPCLGGVSSVTTEVCESVDFLRASKEYIDLNEVKSDETTSQACSDTLSMSGDNNTGKRKCDTPSEQVAKKVKTNRHRKGQQQNPRNTAKTVNPAAQYMHQDKMQYPGQAYYNYGQYQMPAYYQASAQSKYYPSVPQQQNFYGNNYMPYPMGYYQNSVYNSMAQEYMAQRNMAQGTIPRGNMAQENMAHGNVSPYWNSGLQTALNLWHQRQHNTIQSRGNERWYALPKEDSSEQVLDLSHLSQSPDTQRTDLVDNVKSFNEDQI